MTIIRNALEGLGALVLAGVIGFGLWNVFDGSTRAMVNSTQLQSPEQSSINSYSISANSQAGYTNLSTPHTNEHSLSRITPTKIRYAERLNASQGVR